MTGTAAGGGGLLGVGCRSWTKLSGNMPRTPFSIPSHQPSSTWWRVSVRGCGSRWRVSGECEGCGRNRWRVSGGYVRGVVGVGGG